MSRIPLRTTPRFSLLTIALCLFFCAGSLAAGPAPVDLQPMGSLLLLDNGRVKPLDSYARRLLLQFSGRQGYAGQSATSWLCRTLLDPRQAADDRVFLINNPELADALGITVQKRRRYSFNELKNGYHRLISMAQSVPTAARERSPFENEILRTADNLRLYLSLTATFVFLQPHPEFTIDDPEVKSYLGFEPGLSQVSFLDLISRSARLSTAMAQIQNKAQADWTAFDRAIVTLTRSLYQWSQAEENQPLPIIPRLERGGLSWHAPWQAVVAFGSRAAQSSSIVQLAAMQAAYEAADQQGFETAVAAFNALVRQELAGGGQAVNAGPELTYNRVDPFFKSKLAYGLAGLLTVLLLLFAPRQTGPGRLLYLCTLVLSVTGLALHSYGVIARGLILSRPPVTNLYETFVFVAWTCVLLGLILELVQKQRIGLLIASIAGFGFLHLAGKFNFDGDSMGMLAAVLNSSFWLTTHIMTISLGYAGCCSAGIVGHVYLINRIVRRQSAQQTARLAATLYGVLGFGLLFTLIGTLLGGMWADQSWGRFWGWDPKENGALLIILWCTILLHARAGRMMADVGLAAGAIVGLMLVIFAWIGVNVLGVGLHSYGFTSQGASLLFGITLTETLFLTAMGVIHIAYSRKRRAS